MLIEAQVFLPFFITPTHQPSMSFNIQSVDGGTESSLGRGFCVSIATKL